MRLWSVHPKYLDRAGLTAVWRESLLAQHVLRGQTRGYKNHPQLLRFKQQEDPVGAVATYLEGIAAEAARRTYQFNADKIDVRRSTNKIPVTRGQVEYEWQHLLTKLQRRAPELYKKWSATVEPEAHPLFYVVDGKVEEWEKFTIIVDD